MSQGLYVGILRCSLLIPHSSSLKDRRRVLRSLIDRFQNKKNWNLSVIDVSQDHLVNGGEIVMISGGISYSQTLEKFDALERKIYEFEDRADCTILSLCSEVFEYGKHKD